MVGITVVGITVVVGAAVVVGAIVVVVVTAAHTGSADETLNDPVSPKPLTEPVLLVGAVALSKVAVTVYPECKPVTVAMVPLTVPL